MCTNQKIMRFNSKNDFMQKSSLNKDLLGKSQHDTQPKLETKNHLEAKRLTFHCNEVQMVSLNSHKVLQICTNKCRQQQKSLKQMSFLYVAHVVLK